MVITNTNGQGVNVTYGPEIIPTWPMNGEGMVSWGSIEQKYQKTGINLLEHYIAAFRALREANPACNIQWSFNSGDLTIYSACECSSLNQSYFFSPALSKQVPRNYTSMPTANFLIRGYTFPMPNLYTTSHALNPQSPGSSPWVTSVGATGVAFTDRRLTANASAVLSVWNGGFITGGGGFCSQETRPEWQSAAVTQWLRGVTQLANLTDRPQNARTNRGYPDVSMVGHNFLVYPGNVPGGGNPGQPWTGVDGTSASAPVFAAMISKVNSNRIAAGKAPLGFINPVLYKIAKEHPDAFLDVSKGDNKCTRNWCSTMGWDATEGWDPASGLGSINLPVFAKYAEQYGSKTTNDGSKTTNDGSNATLGLNLYNGNEYTHARICGQVSIQRETS